MGLFTYLINSMTPGKDPHEVAPGHYGESRGLAAEQHQDDGHATDAEVRDAVGQMQERLNSCITGSVWKEYDHRTCTQPENMTGEEVPGSNGHRKKVTLFLREPKKVYAVGPLHMTRMSEPRKEEVVVTWGERGRKDPEKILVSWPGGGDELPPIPKAKETMAALSFEEGWEKAKADYGEAASTALTATMSALKSADKVAANVQKSVSKTAGRLIEEYVPTSVQAWGQSFVTAIFGEDTIREVDLIPTDRDPVA